MSSSIAIAAARGILLKHDRTLLAEFGSHVQLSTSWVRSLLQGMNFIQRKATTSKSRHTSADFIQLKTAFLNDIVTVVTCTIEETPPELALNWDQTGIKLVLCSSWTMEHHGQRRVEIMGMDDKRLITAVFFLQQYTRRFLAGATGIQKEDSPLSSSLHLPTWLAY